MGDNIYEKLKKGKAKKTTEEVVDDLVEVIEEKKEETKKEEGSIREAVDLYYDKALRKYVRVTIKYNDTSKNIVSIESVVSSANMAIELSNVNTHFVNKIMKKR